jgi:hypothetical protein
MLPTWTPEHVVAPEQAERLIREQFPELAPLRLETVGEGYDNTVYRVNEAYTFRFPRRAIVRLRPRRRPSRRGGAAQLEQCPHVTT